MIKNGKDAKQNKGLPTRSPTLSGTSNVYRPKGGDALRLGSKAGWFIPRDLWINVWVKLCDPVKTRAILSASEISCINRNIILRLLFLLLFHNCWNVRWRHCRKCRCAIAAAGMLLLRDRQTDRQTDRETERQNVLCYCFRYRGRRNKRRCT